MRKGPHTSAPRKWPTAVACLFGTPLFFLLGCSAVPAAGWSLPSDWSTAEPLVFERMALRNLPDGRVTALAPSTIQELAAALNAPPPLSVRAAVLLGRSRDPLAEEALLLRLERRVSSSARDHDAGDVVAAAALASFPSPRSRSARLLPLALASGSQADAPGPHPDLEVRVEIAGTLLTVGEDAPLTFLLQVLRIDTWAGRADPRDFEAGPTTAWARSRAARFLSLRAGLEPTYEADASIADRQREALLLAAALGIELP